MSYHKLLGKTEFQLHRLAKVRFVAISEGFLGLKWAVEFASVTLWKSASLLGTKILSVGMGLGKGTVKSEARNGIWSLTVCTNKGLALPGEYCG